MSRVELGIFDMDHHQMVGPCYKVMCSKIYYL